MSKTWEETILEGPRKLFHPPNNRKDKHIHHPSPWFTSPDLRSPTRISLLLPEWNSAFDRIPAGGCPITCLNNGMEAPNLAEEPGQVFFNLSLIPRPMNVFFKKLQANEVERAEAGDGHQQKRKEGGSHRTDGQQAPQG